MGCINNNNGNGLQVFEDDFEDCGGGGCCVERELRRNIGRVVTVFTESGGESGSGFTGLVSRVREGCVRLITSIPSAPFERFNNRERRRSGDCCFNLCEHCRNSHFGSVVVIPIRKIVAVAAVEI